MWMKGRMGNRQEVCYHLIIKITVMGIMIIMGIVRIHLLCSGDCADLSAWAHLVGEEMGKQRFKPQFAWQSKLHSKMPMRTMMLKTNICWTFTLLNQLIRKEEGTWAHSTFTDGILALQIASLHNVISQDHSQRTQAFRRRLLTRIWGGKHENLLVRQYLSKSTLWERGRE